MTKKKTIKKKASTKHANGLSAKEISFVNAYFKNHFNGTQAALESGLGKTDGSAAVMASRMLSTVKISTEISKRLYEAGGITADRVAKELAKLAFAGDLADFDKFFEDGEKLSELAKAGVDTSLVKKIKRRVETSGGLNYESREIELYDKLVALGYLVKVLGMITDKVEHSGALTLADVVQAAASGDLSTLGKK